jgi:hypothetical protein
MGATQGQLERARRKEATKRQEEMIEVPNMEMDPSSDAYAASQLQVRPHPRMHQGGGSWRGQRLTTVRVCGRLPPT